MKRPLLAILLLTVTTLAISNSITAASATTYSLPNDVYNYIVNGQSNSTETITGTPTDTVVQYAGQQVEFQAYYDQYWSAIPNGYFYQLVNVTSSTFRLGFMYLSLDNPSLIKLFLYDYSLGTCTLYFFNGQSKVDSQTIVTQPVPIPDLDFQLSTSFPNTVFISGPNVQLQGNVGTYFGQSAYVIWTYTNVLNQWNEVWLLTTDGPSGYNFVCIYTYFDSPTDVHAGYSLDLNNYQFTPYPQGSGSLGSWQLETP